jgi:hypothetical protein
MLSHHRIAASAAVIALIAGMLVVTGQTAAAEVRQGTVTTTAGSHAVTATVSVGDASVPQWGKGIQIHVTYASPTAAVTAAENVNKVVVTHRASGHSQTATLSRTGDDQVAWISTSGAETGTFDVGLHATADVDGATATFEQDQVTSFTVTRETRPWIEVWPGMVLKGNTYKVRGGLEWFDAGTYLPADGAQVSLWFTPKGSTSAVRRKTVTLGSTGRFSTSFVNDGPGKWEMRFAGGTRYTPSSASVTMSNFSRGTHVATYTQKVSGTWYSTTVTASDIDMTLKGATMAVDVRFRHNGTAIVWDTDGSVQSRNAERVFWIGQLDRVSDGHYTGKIDFPAFAPAGMYTVGGLTDAKVYYGPGQDDYDWHFVVQETMTPFVLRRNTLLDAYLSTSTPTRGQEYAVKGRLRKIWVNQSNQASYQPAPSASVRLYFNPAGPLPARYVRSVRTNWEGRFSTRVEATRSGVWTAKYAGTTMTYLGSTDTASVTVR